MSKGDIMDKSYKVTVFVSDGNRFSEDVFSLVKLQMFLSAVVKDGYTSRSSKLSVFYLPASIVKISFYEIA